MKRRTFFQIVVALTASLALPTAKSKPLFIKVEGSIPRRSTSRFIKPLHEGMRPFVSSTEKTYDHVREQL